MKPPLKLGSKFIQYTYSSSIVEIVVKQDKHHHGWVIISTINYGRNYLIHWGRDKMAAIYQTTFSNAFPWMKMYEFRLKFHWSLFVRLKFVRKGSINNIPALVLIMAWRRPGDKPLSGPMMVRLPTHICVARPQWVNTYPCPNLSLCGINSWHLRNKSLYPRPI